MTTFLEQEIRSQGSVLRERAERGRAQAERVAESFRDVSYALVAARGSSDNAAIFFQYLAAQELGLLVALATPSLYEAGAAIGLDGAGVLAVSQSGQTPGLVAVLERAISQGRPNAAVTNDAASPLASMAGLVIELGAGTERAIAATKTFSSTWHALAQLVEAMKGSALAGLGELPDLVERTATWALERSLLTKSLDVAGGVTVIGRGVGQSAAAEIALKIREVAGIRSESFAAPDFLHGPIGAGGVGSTMMLVVTEDLSDEEIVLAESAPNWSIALAEIVVGQVLALRLGEQRGRPIDTAPGLNKVTLSA
jgi:glucosamine--fructose-6-phosphate aminotransferase (isomerizing)